LVWLATRLTRYHGMFAPEISSGDHTACPRGTHGAHGAHSSSRVPSADEAGDEGLAKFFSGHLTELCVSQIGRPSRRSRGRWKQIEWPAREITVPVI